MNTIMIGVDIMNSAKVGSECIACILDKYLTAYPPSADETTKQKYMKNVLRLLADLPDDVSAPEAVAQITSLQKQILGIEDNYAEEKKHFNALMMKAASHLSQKIEHSDDPLYTAVCYALAGNYIDFGAMKNVEEDKLAEVLEQSVNFDFGRDEYENLKNDIVSASQIVYLTDNCGEIVCDKLLISAIKKYNPGAEVHVVVRGAPVLNDATTDDAHQIELDSVAPVISNGTPVAGTCLNLISSEAKALIDNADVIISKGQGNFETLVGCGLNVYYLFLCKCEMFAKRFGVERFAEMLINDMRA